MLGSLAVVVGKGISDIGGLKVVWERAEQSGRVEFLKYEF